MALINLGNIADDGTGDDLRTAFSKINGAFTSLGITSPGGSGSGSGSGSGASNIVTTDSNGDIYVNKVFFKNSFTSVAGLPSAATYPGMFVYVAGDGAYVSNGTTWKKLPTWNNSGVVTGGVLRWNGSEFTATDTGVKSFNNQTGDVILNAGDIANALGGDALTDAGGRIAIDPYGNITFGTGASLGVTGFIKMPSGTIAQRPVIPVLGMFRYNNETDTFEGYVGPSSGPAWRTVGPLGTGPAAFTNVSVTGTATVNNLIATAINGPLGTVTPAAATVTNLTVSGAAAFSNDVTLTSNTPSNALGTGALVISGIGGASVGGNLFVGGTVSSNGLNATSTTQSSAPTNGAVTVAGGVGIGKNLNVGGNLGITGTSTLAGVTFSTNTTESTSTTTGALVVAGGVGIAKNLTVGGAVASINTTQSTSTTTGAVTVAGGVGIAKNLNVGGDLEVTGFIKNNFIEYASGVASPTPAVIKSNSIHGFNAYGSTDFPGNYYSGWTVKGGIVGAQIAIGWDIDEVGSATKIYVRANDDTGTTTAWSTWERVITASNLPVATSSVLGNVKIGTGINVAVDGTISAATQIQSDWTQATTTALDYIKNKPTYTTNGVAYASSTSALSTGSALTFNGTDLTCTGNITAYSDIRLKTNLKVIDDALAKVNQLSGYTFDRIDMSADVGRQTGVIAQEVKQVLPEAVSESSDGMYSVAYGNMVGLLIESIKELNSQVKLLKAELAELKGL